ncbi:NAD(P)/FAD-dependent oxidoreductase [Paenalcaligenes suwonensis]|uniref:NAD(P)/FAD-dependent oxidoreductase n=1 Tax=Paenalcaligenes suwonensis TaxID=1202713 RepID=UPI00140861E8|nr:FAD-binding oxidoreductase [Paenalcaligenes suwonensis]NHC61043.1 FAD-binding oxidoreductase [Paenalcaligenes suwonensis]
MIHPAPNVVVVGGGIMGACIAWNLAKAGIRVTVLEQQARPAAGATWWSYGWVGTASAFPSEAPNAFALKQQALREFASLERDLSSLPYAARGALVWCENDHETAHLVAEQQAVGVAMNLIDRLAIQQLEPQLRELPTCAAWAPNDFALEPIQLTQQLLQAAQALGAELRYNVRVDSLVTQGDKVIGVRSTQGDINADVVMLANGIAAQQLLLDYGVAAPITEAPAVLMRWQASETCVHHLICADDLELRPDRQGGIVVAMDYPEEGEAGLESLVLAVKKRLEQMIMPSPTLSLHSMAGAYRPLTHSGMPYREMCAAIKGLYVTVAHPGIILGPYLARLSVEEVLNYLANQKFIYGF